MTRTRVLFALLAAAAAALSACRANYAVDVRNQTPQPLFAQVFERDNSGAQTVLAGRRLGPGDRAAVGPVRGRVGRVGLALDTPGNPGGIVIIDLAAGTSVFNVTQEGDGAAGPLVVREVTR